MKFRNFFFIFLILVISAATSVVGYSFYKKYEELSINYFSKFLADNQQFIRANIENFIFEKTNDILLMSSKKVLTNNFDSKKALPELLRIRNTYKNYEALEIVDTNFTTIVHTSQLNIGETSLNAKLAATCFTSKKMEFDLFTDDRFFKGKIRICQPIVNTKNEIQHVLLAYIPINRALEEISKIEGNHMDYIHSNIELRTSNNQIIFKSHLDEFHFDEAIPHNENMPNAPSMVRYENDIYIHTHFNPIPSSSKFEWLLISKISLNEIKAPFQDLAKKFFIGGILFLMLIFAFSHWILFKLLKPFESLSHSMSALAKGEFEKIPITHSLITEINNLINGYNLMIDNLKNSLAESSRNSKFAALGQMSSGIAHEINNPLTIIKGLAYITPRLVESDQKQKLIDNSKKIEDTVDRIARIIKSLRAYARDEAQEPMKKESVLSVINSTMDLCSEKYKNMGIDIQIDLPKTELFVNVRAFQITQILINLLNNASEEVIKYNGEKWIRIQATSDNSSQIVVSVENSGPKISTAIAEKLFIPFFTTKEPGKGTGLGLSISHGIAKSHHGDLQVDLSAPNTKFILVLPAYIEDSHLKVA